MERKKKRISNGLPVTAYIYRLIEYLWKPKYLKYLGFLFWEFGMRIASLIQWVKILIKALNIFAHIWIIGVSIFISICLALIIIKDGWLEFTKIMSPFNLINWFTVIVTLSPGLAALFLVNSIERKYFKEERKLIQKI